MDLRRHDECMDKLYSDMCYKIMRINFFIIVGLLIFEILFFFLYWAFDLMTVSPLKHIVLYIIRPIGLCSLFYALSVLIVKKRDKLKLSQDFLYLVPFGVLVVIISITTLVHYVFPVLYTSFMMPICLSVIFSEKKITRNVYILSNVSFAITIALTYLDDISVKPNKFMFNIACTYAVLYFTFLFARQIVMFEEQKESMIVSFASKNQVLIREANTDGLTGLYNFKMLEKTTNEWIANGTEIVFCIVDIDNFKQVNDTYGHEFGNVVLKRLATELKSISSDIIVPARYGGEEFSILMKGSDVEFAWQIVDSLRRRFKTQEYREIETGKQFTFSGGVAKYVPGMTANDLYKAADSLLYEAKQTGKNKILYQKGAK